MTESVDVGWDVDFWANRYPPHYLAVYNREIQKSPSEKLRGLWGWKSLNRANFTPEDVDPHLDEAIELCKGLEGAVADIRVDDVAQIFEKLRERLKDDGVLSTSSRAVVTPQFLLHLADSQGSYSGRFPILDVMVARAHRVHTTENESTTLQHQLSCSQTSYRRLIRYFFNNCDTANQVAQLERALFIQGRAIAWCRTDEGKYDKIGKVPVESARKHLNEIIQLTIDGDRHDQFR